MRFRAIVLSMVTALALAGCAPPGAGPTTAPVAPNFVFNPPSTSPIRPDMAIGILKAEPIGSLWVEQYVPSPGVAPATRPRAFVDQLLDSSQRDMEKILVAKGFPTAGTYPTLDEMTYSQKQRAFLILRPTFEVNLQLTREGGFGSGQSATVSGVVNLELIEPVTREKIWIKRLALEPFTKVVVSKSSGVSLADLLAPPPSAQATAANNTQIQDNSVVLLLNTFYAAAMQKIWDHLDPVELASLQRQTNEVRRNSTHTAH